jgi:RNA polymerase sigma-70 factor, ECF subfamily
VAIEVRNNGHNSEADWIIRAQAGDKAAYGELVGHYQRLLVSVAYRQGLDLVEAEDVAQEAFVKAWLALPKYKPSVGSWRAWLCRITINLAIDSHRRQRPRLDLDEALADQGPGPAEQAEMGRRAKLVRQAMAQLPPASRAALILCEYEDLSYAEIATALDIPLGTVMSRLNYARRRLRELLVVTGEIV